MARSWIKIALVSLGISALVPLAAYADDSAGKARSEARVEKKGRGDKAKEFPMPTAKFKEKVEGRITKSRARIESKMKEKSVPADKQKTALAAFDAGAVKVRAAADAAGKDGTVTFEEAKGVRELTKQLRKDARGKVAGKKKKA
jgi:hypothetical protein